MVSMPFFVKSKKRKCLCCKAFSLFRGLRKAFSLRRPLDRYLVAVGATVTDGSKDVDGRTLVDGRILVVGLVVGFTVVVAFVVVVGTEVLGVGLLLFLVQPTNIAARSTTTSITMIIFFMLASSFVLFSAQ
jgi:hypothetical protein